MELSRLSAVPLFSGLPAADVDALAGATSELSAAEGDVIVAKGEFGHALYVIESGNADVRDENDETLTPLGPGDTFGEIAVVSAGRRTASVVATTPMRLLVIFKRDVWALEQRSPEAAARLRALVTERVAK